MTEPSSALEIGLGDVLGERDRDDRRHRDGEHREHDAVGDAVVLEVDRGDRDDERTEQEIGQEHEWIVDLDRHRDEQSRSDDLDYELAATRPLTTRWTRPHRSDERHERDHPPVRVTPRALGRSEQGHTLCGVLDGDAIDDDVEECADDQPCERADDGGSHGARLLTANQGAGGWVGDGRSESALD